MTDEQLKALTRALLPYVFGATTPIPRTERAPRRAESPSFEPAKAQADSLYLSRVDLEKKGRPSDKPTRHPSP